MIYEFRLEDILDGQIRRRIRKEGQGWNQFVEFELPEVAPTENLRIMILDNSEHGDPLGEILLER